VSYASGGREELTERATGWQERALGLPARPMTLWAATKPLRTLAQCGTIMGCSTSRAGAIEQSALAKLRKGLIESGIVDEQGRVVRGGEE
jgi:hypothetical protein